MKTIAIHPDGSTSIPGYPDGFPVDGDAMVVRYVPRGRTSLKMRARVAFLSDAGAIRAARTSLASSFSPDEPGQVVPTSRMVERWLASSYPGGTAAFLATLHSQSNDLRQAA